MICNWKSAFMGLLFLVFKLSRFFLFLFFPLRKTSHVTASVINASHEPIFHKYLSGPLDLDLVP